MTEVSPRAVARIVAARRFGGGLHVDHLASLLHREPGDRELMTAIWRARRCGWLDYWHGYVMAEVTPGRARGSPARPDMNQEKRS